MKRLLLCFTFSVAFNSNSQIQGKVVDASSGEPIIGAKIYALMAKEPFQTLMVIIT